MINMLKHEKGFQDQGFNGNQYAHLCKDMYVGANPLDRRYSGMVDPAFWDAKSADLANYLVNVMGSQSLEMRNGYLVNVNPAERLAKANIGTGDAGPYNAIFGAAATIQVVQQQNAFGAVRKEGYAKAGYRVITAAALTAAAGIAQAGALGTAVVPTYVEISVGLKEVEIVTDVSTRLQLVAGKDDVVTFDENAQAVFSNFMTSLDYDLLTTVHTTANLNIESLDRVCASSLEATAHSYDSGDINLHGVARTSSTYFNANADYASANRAINTSLVDALMRDQMPYWGSDFNNKFYLTHPDTWVNWSALDAANFRRSGDMYMNTMAGVQPTPGMAGGFRLAQYDTYPIVLDSQVVQDGAGRLYLIDSNTTSISMAAPIKVYTSDNPFEVGHLKRAAWYGVMETKCTLPKANGKLMDLSA